MAAVGPGGEDAPQVADDAQTTTAPAAAPTGGVAARVTPPPVTVGAESFGEELRLMAAFFFVFGIPHVLLALTLLLSGAFWFLGNRAALVALLAVLSTGVWPATVYWPAFIDHPVWDLMQAYFSFEVRSELPDVAKPGEHYLFAEFPHGVFPIGSILSQPWVRKVHGLEVHAFVASILFRLPLMRQLVSWFGCQPANKKDCLRGLERGHCCLFPGGVAELLLTSRSCEAVYLNRRKGFVKLALETGASLVPVYGFGHTQLFEFVPLLPGWVSRLLSASLVFFFGRWGMPVPYRRRILFVVGQPIPIERVAKPTDEQVEALHARFTEALVALFEKYKAEYSEDWSERKLQVR